MTGGILLALLAGTLTTLSPCVLPILPIVLLGALDQHRLGPVALGAGMAITFSGLGIALSGAGWALDIPGDTIRTSAAVLMGLFGLILTSSLLQQRFAALGNGGLFNDALARFTPEGLRGQFALGALLGAVWTPCAGPTLGAAATLAANSRTAGVAALTMLVFGIGACIPLLAIAYGSRHTLRARRDLLLRLGRASKPVLGMLLILAAALVLSGLDKAIEAALVPAMPDWLVGLTTRY